MKKLGLFSLLTALLLGTATTASAQDKIVIKFGTRAPVNSTWHNKLKEAAEKWREVSGGKVELKIFAGGTMGDEGDMIKKMKVGQLQAVGVSTVGLHVIAPDPQAIDIPMMVSNREEYRCALGKVAPTFEKALEAKGVVVLAWGEIGFTRFFSTESRPTLAEMRKAKMFSWEGDPDSVTAWKNAGFSPVVLSSADLVPSLQTKKIVEIFRQSSKDIDSEVVKMEKDSLDKLVQKGVTVVPVQDLPEWQKAMDAVYQDIRGKIVPAQAFDEVRKAIKECRGGK